MSKPMYVDLDFQNAARITNLPDPSSGQHPATKAYVDTALLGIDNPMGVKARTTGNITIATALNNADTIDGVTLATGDLVLVDQQTTASEDGVYVVGVSPVRSTDLAVGNDARGLLVVVEAGTANGGKLFMQTANPAIVGTNGLSFTAIVSGTTYTGSTGVTLVGSDFQLASSTAGNGLTFSSGVLAVGATDTSITVGADSVGVNLAASSGLSISSGLKVDYSTVARWNTALGPASAGATITQAHGFGHKELIVQVKLESTGKDITDGVEVACDATNITVTFASSQADRSAFRLVWVG